MEVDEGGGDYRSSNSLKIKNKILKIEKPHLY